MTRILIIDDDVEMCELLKSYFEREEFTVDYVHNGPDGLSRFWDEGCDLLILDVMLPGKNGIDVLREIRGRSNVPVIMLTAKGDSVDRVVGLEVGADDYVAKPFDTRELVARVRAVLRRRLPAVQENVNNGNGNSGNNTADVLHVEDLEYRQKSRSIYVGGKLVPLTGIEFRLLELLVKSAGEPVELGRLSQEGMGRPYNPFDRALNVHIGNIRRKLGSYPEGGQRIKTLRNVGFVYVFADPVRDRKSRAKS